MVRVYETDVFEMGYSWFARDLLKVDPVDVGEVHAQKVDDPNWISRELQNVVFQYSIPDTPEVLAIDVRPNLDWAEEHFQERVSGIPHNPPPSAERWPYAQRGHEEHLINGKFSHTYPERMWPRYAAHKKVSPEGRQLSGQWGIRYPYADLNDLVRVLVRNPYTRQAYLPIWFPEDLNAALYEQRVPCTLGWHFMMREDKLNMTYFIRSCDLVRFFRDDVYMACRLVQWVAEKLRDADLLPLRPDAPQVEVGTLTMHIVSLHCFEGDLPNLRKNYAIS